MGKFIIHTISDTHRAHAELTPKLSGGDLLIHAGDSGCFNERTTESFLKWCIKVADKYTHGMILIAGNHDIHIAEFEDNVRDFLIGSNVQLLTNQSVEVAGFRVFGSPYSVTFGDRWVAFSGNEFELKNRIWSRIPDEVDILVTHSPPLGVLDSGYGSKSLREKVLEIKPKIHVFGHIHHERGVLEQGEIKFVNAASLHTLDGRPTPPIVIEIERKRTPSETQS